jgi:hypothetical protein
VTKKRKTKKRKTGAHARDATTGAFTTMADAKARPASTVVERSKRREPALPPTLEELLDE